MLVKDLTFEINNNIRGLDALSYLGAADLKPGDFGVTGTLNIYFEDGYLYERFMSEGAFSLALTLAKDGVQYVFEWPRCKVSSDAMPIEGRNQDVMETVEWQALKDSTAGYTMRIVKS
jgi:hypothetical protein